MRLLKPIGDYLRKKANTNLVYGILCLALFGVLLVTSIDILPFYVSAGRYETSRGIALGLFMAGWYYFLLHEYPNFRAGMIGEQRVAKTLSLALSDEYSLFNDVKLKSMTWGNIDHIVVGPTGIFVIETKNYRGKISYYGDNWEGIGRRKPPSNQARINAMRIKKILDASGVFRPKSLYVQGIVVFANNQAELTEKKPPEYVKIKRIDELATFIKSEPKRFQAGEIKQIELELQNGIRNHQ